MVSRIEGLLEGAASGRTRLRVDSHAHACRLACACVWTGMRLPLRLHQRDPHRRGRQQRREALQHVAHRGEPVLGDEDHVPRVRELKGELAAIDAALQPRADRACPSY